MADDKRHDGDSTTKIQLAVEMTCEKCSTDIKLHLKANEAIKNVAVNLEKQTVLLETALPTNEVVKLIEATGKKALITGVGAAGSEIVNLGCAVAIMHEGNPASGVRGVTRLVQSTMNTCVVDGTLDGLAPNTSHRLTVHEYGDISDGCNSCGEILDLPSSKVDGVKELYGDLGELLSDESGCTSFRIESERFKVWDIIGRSMVIASKKVTHQPSHPEWTRLACGVIARSAGIFENMKRICACDGSTIWEEQKFYKAKDDRRSSQL